MNKKLPNMGVTQYVIARSENGATFMHAWWTEGAYLYLYQMCDIDPNDALKMVNGAVNVDPMSGDNLSVVIQDCWEGYTILEFNPNYTG